VRTVKKQIARTSLCCDAVCRLNVWKLEKMARSGSDCATTFYCISLRFCQVVFPDFGVSALTFAVSNATNANVSRMVGMIERIALTLFLLSLK